MPQALVWVSTGNLTNVRPKRRLKVVTDQDEQTTGAKGALVHPGRGRGKWPSAARGRPNANGLRAFSGNGNPGTPGRNDEPLQNRWEQVTIKQKEEKNIWQENECRLPIAGGVEVDRFIKEKN